MDIMMPDMDGYNTIRQKREEEKNKYLPIIAVTVKVMVGHRKKMNSSRRIGLYNKSDTNRSVAISYAGMALQRRTGVRSIAWRLNIYDQRMVKYC